MEINAEQIIAGGIETASQFVGKPNPAAQAINFLASAGISAWSLINQKKQAKEDLRVQQWAEIVEDHLGKFFATLNETGIFLIDNGLVPGSEEFEFNLYNNLYSIIGYKGNCNATVWAPGTKPENPNRPVWFEASYNGRIVRTTEHLPYPPSDLNVRWQTKCSGIRDYWYTYYRNKLIAEGRQKELEEFNKDISNLHLIVNLTFGSLFAIGGFLIYKNRG